MRKTFFLVTIIFAVIGCSEKKKWGENVKNTYYIEFSVDNDSLKNSLIKYIDGKTTFHLGKKLEIVPVTYLTETHPDIHYFKSIDNLSKEIPKGTKKISLKVTGNLSTDSTFYSIPRFMYDGTKWNKISDIGEIKALLDPSLSKRPKFHRDELVNMIREAIFNSTYE